VRCWFQELFANLQRRRPLDPGALLAVDAAGMVLGFSGITALNAVRFKALWSLCGFRGWRSAVSDQDTKCSDLVEIAKRNGDFRKNWAVVIGSVLYLWTARLSSTNQPALRTGG
jgi:hypothetical protein